MLDQSPDSETYVEYLGLVPIVFFQSMQEERIFLLGPS